MSDKTDMPRYKVMEKSKSAHCCFEATVMDTTKPENYSDSHGQHYESICECFSSENAKFIADSLNATDTRSQALLKENDEMAAVLEEALNHLEDYTNIPEKIRSILDKRKK